MNQAKTYSQTYFLEDATPEGLPRFSFAYNWSMSLFIYDRISIREDIELSYKAIFSWSSEILFKKAFLHISLAFMNAKSQGSLHSDSLFNLLIYFQNLPSNEYFPNILFFG